MKDYGILKILYASRRGRNKKKKREKLNALLRLYYYLMCLDIQPWLQHRFIKACTQFFI